MSESESSTSSCPLPSDGDLLPISTVVVFGLRVKLLQMAIPYDPNFTMAIFDERELTFNDDLDHDSSASAAVVAVIDKCCNFSDLDREELVKLTKS
ncbi:hypothetical protein AALP_AAs45078U000100 [Arabis alpina]|uniref:Uncharacterized protein n=1 Tax=Arabis alpina TaxID=50452 RepID=A0A087G3X2_ARAAL|nr:hypothetical protein AALP_AAs45078U000100 [Arabis alpina]